MPVRIEINHAEVERLLYSPTGPVHREVSRVTSRVESAVKRRCPVEEGLLRASVYSLVYAVRGVAVIGEVGSPLEYAIYVELGTGIYGPSGGMIRPRRARFLVWESKGGQVIFARQVRGQPGQHMFRDGLIEASPWPVVVTPI